MNSSLGEKIVPPTLKVCPAPQETIAGPHNTELLRVVDEVVIKQLPLTLDEAYYLGSFQSGFRPGYGPKGHWLHIWMKFGRKGMGIVYPSWLCFSSWWLSISSTMVFLYTNSME